MVVKKSKRQIKTKNKSIIKHIHKSKKQTRKNKLLRGGGRKSWLKLPHWKTRKEKYNSYIKSRNSSTTTPAVKLLYKTHVDNASFKKNLQQYYTKTPDKTYNNIRKQLLQTGNITKADAKLLAYYLTFNDEYKKKLNEKENVVDVNKPSYVTQDGYLVPFAEENLTYSKALLGQAGRPLLEDISGYLIPVSGNKNQAYSEALQGQVGRTTLTDTEGYLLPVSGNHNQAYSEASPVKVNTGYEEVDFGHINPVVPPRLPQLPTRNKLLQPYTSGSLPQVEEFPGFNNLEFVNVKNISYNPKLSRKNSIYGVLPISNPYLPIIRQDTQRKPLSKGFKSAHFNPQQTWGFSNT